VRDFHACIGKETRKQAMEKWGGKPDILVACVGGGSNAMGLFHEFVEDEDVRLVGVEAAGFGVDTDKHAATLTLGSPGVLHGSFSYLIQDSEGQVGQRSLLYLPLRLPPTDNNIIPLFSVSLTCLVPR
jgi:tryptophan synthase beta chain